MNPVAFSTKAILQLRNLMNTLDLEKSQVLRLGVKNGRCAGTEYLMAFDKRDENDQEYMIDGLTVVIDKKQIMFILGMKIDWEDNENGKGFVFKNP